MRPESDPKRCSPAQRERAKGVIIWRTGQVLTGQERPADIEPPSRATLCRLFDKLAAGTHATGSARTRRSVGARPSGPFGEIPASGPRELMQLDSPRTAPLKRSRC